ncbi:MAG: tetratricopeptide repeat protein [Fimbriimonadaceae bacterium]|nr:tetratricopeptide repeat protein [Fimbriimonadaceae bacterium]
MRLLLVLGTAMLALSSVPARAVLALPLPIDCLPRATADQWVAAASATPQPDEALTKAVNDLVDYLDPPRGLTLTVSVVPLERGLAVALPNGSLYLSSSVQQALRADAERTAFLLASLAALVIDGTDREDEAVAAALEKGGAQAPTGFWAALEGLLTPERVAAADRVAILGLVRAGLPPLEGVRALDDLARAGYDNLTLTDPRSTPSLLDRKVKATQAAADLIKAASEFDLAVVDLVEKDYETAAQRFQSFLEIIPRNYAGWNNLGLCEYHLACEPLGPPRLLLADAIAEFDTSYLTRSRGRPDMERWQNAFEAYRRAAELDPLRVEALSNLGNLHAVANDYVKARHYYDLVLSVQPRFAPALNNYGVVLAEEIQGDFPEAALAKFQAAVAADTTLAEAQFNLGAALRELAREGWQEPFKRYLALNPSGQKANSVQLALGSRPTQPTGPTVVAAAENDLELWNRVHLALATGKRDLVAMVASRPDQDRGLPNTNLNVMEWSSEGLVVELLAGRVNRVLAGRPPGHEAKTQKGVKVGYTADDLKAQYGAPPAVSKQNGFDVWLYPQAGLGFFVRQQGVNKIFLFQVQTAEQRANR